MLNSNSLRAYRLKVQPELTKREAEVLQAIREIGQGTMYEVANHMRVYPNVISGRFKPLKEKGRIIDRQSNGKSVWREVEKETRTLSIF